MFLAIVTGGLHWTLSDNKSTRYSGILCILTVLSSSLVFAVRAPSLTFNYSSSLFLTFWRRKKKTGTAAMFLFYTFLSSLIRSGDLPSFHFSLDFEFMRLWSVRTTTSIYCIRSNLFIANGSGSLAWIEWFVWITKSQRILCTILSNRIWFIHLSLTCMIKMHLPTKPPGGSPFLTSHVCSFGIIWYIRLLLCTCLYFQRFFF